ncbi:bifunctional DNA primase/polymerase [Paenibacillus sp. PvR148]
MTESGVGHGDRRRIHATLSSNQLNAMTTQEAALAYASANFLLIPVCHPRHEGASEHHKATCGNPGKAPRIGNWSARGTDDPETISEWFGEWPESNVGMLTGSKAGIVGIDADGAYGESRVHELFGGEPPLTWAFSTPGGGARYLLGIPKGTAYQKYTDRGPNGGHEELSILADGQLTVLPPSLHRNGGRYEWLPGRGPGDVPLADAPQAILKLLSPKTTVKTTLDGEAEPFERPSVPKRDQDTITGSSPSADQILDVLTKKCEKMRNFVEEQKGIGCDEDSWHKVTAMLVRAGYPEAARAFSQLSGKHDARNEQRIAQMAAEGDSASYGPTRCRTFGCGEEQISKCFGTVRTNGEDEITNSPALFVSPRKAKKASAFSAKIRAKADLLPERYSVRGSNLCLALKDKDGEQTFVPQANFFAWINKDIVKDDGAERQRFYELEGCILYNGKRLPPILVPASDFESMKWLAGWGLSRTSSRATRSGIPSATPSNRRRAGQ